MKLSIIAATLLFTFAGLSTGCTADSATAEQPQVDDAVDSDVTSSARQAQLNGLRARVERDFGNVTRSGFKLVFKVEALKSDANMAFIRARILKRNAQGNDFELTSADIDGSAYAAEAREGLFDGPLAVAALKKDGTTWSVIQKSATNEAYVVGPTDVAWTDWDTEFGVPRAWLF